MESVWFPGTLCDQHVFGTLPLFIGGPAHHFRTSDYSSVQQAADAALSGAPTKFVAIGFSLGGFIALELLRRAPDRMAGVVLISGNAHPDPAENAASRRAELQFASARGMAALIQASWARLVGPSSQGDSNLRETLVAMAERVGVGGMERQVAMNITRPDFRTVAKSAQVPLLVVAGAEDSLCSRERYEAAAAGRNATLNIVPGAGHFLPLEAPQRVSAIVSPFVRALAA